MKRIIVGAAGAVLLFFGQVLAEEIVLMDFEGEEPAIGIPAECPRGKVEVVKGKVGNAVKVISFETEKPALRYWQLKTKNMNPAKWVEEGYKTIKFWVKGDGSSNIVKLIAEHYEYDGKTYKTLASIEVGNFSLEEIEWHQIVIPLEDKYDTLIKTSSCYLDGPRPYTADQFYFIIDHIAAETNCYAY